MWDDLIFHAVSFPAFVLQRMVNKLAKTSEPATVLYLHNTHQLQLASSTYGLKWVFLYNPHLMIELLLMAMRIEYAVELQDQTLRKYITLVYS